MKHKKQYFVRKTYGHSDATIGKGGFKRNVEVFFADVTRTQAIRFSSISDYLWLARDETIRVDGKTIFMRDITGGKDITELVLSKLN